MHSNARTTPRSRAVMVEQVLVDGVTLKAAAAAFSVTPKTVKKWVDRYRAEGPNGLACRSSRPRHSPRKTPPHRCRQAIVLRAQGITYAEISEHTRLSEATLSRILRAHRNSPPTEAAKRYERDRPGDLLHFDIKQLGRIVEPGHRVTGDRRDHKHGVGWEYVHVCIDDHSRFTHAVVRDDQCKDSAISFLEQVVKHYRSMGITINQVMTDNGPCYRSEAFRKACVKLGVKHLYIQPYRPQTNGKAERVIQSATREWAYAKTYQNSAERTKALSSWLQRYNWRRPHRSLKRKTPVSRLNVEYNVLTTHT